jgi:2-dehydro-3-deoxyphosphogluconate aldolase / (4S)-4-hydroxy-2-oxoglutarate aldolase
MGDLYSGTGWLEHLQQQRVIAVIRTEHYLEGMQMARAAIAAGLTQIEITWNSQFPDRLISSLRAEFPRCWIGAGTLLQSQDLDTAVEAGAQYLVCPHGSLELIDRARQAGVPMVPGALTPSEVIRCWQAGATCVKLFPVQAVGGVSYLRHLQGPLGQIPLIPTGGVNLANAVDFLAAGALAVGLAQDLFPPEAIAAKDWALITQRGQMLLSRLAQLGLIPATTAPASPVGLIGQTAQFSTGNHSTGHNSTCNNLSHSPSGMALTSSEVMPS